MDFCSSHWLFILLGYQIVAVEFVTFSLFKAQTENYWYRFLGIYWKLDSEENTSCCIWSQYFSVTEVAIGGGSFFYELNSFIFDDKLV